MPRIAYPISLAYRKSWGTWEALREFYQNALDEADGFEIDKTAKGLVISDTGQGLKFRHLILGVSDKGENARGSYGEGLKIAILVLLRENYTVRVRAGDLELKSVIDYLEGEPVLAVDYIKIDTEHKGTEILICNYGGETYENRIIRHGTKNVLFEFKDGQIIKEDNPCLYVKEIFCQEISKYEFSYNLAKIKLDHERNVADPYSIRRNVGYIWSQVKDSKLIQQFLMAAAGRKGEEAADIVTIPDENHKYWQEAFKAVFGDNAVMLTNDMRAAEARIWGGIPIRLPKDIANVLRIKTDEEFIFEKQNIIDDLLDEKILDKTQSGNLAMMRKLAKIVNKDVFINIYNISDIAAKHKDNEIRLNPEVLKDKQQTLLTLIPQLAHICYNTRYNTKAHLSAIQKVSATLLLEFL